MIKFKWLRRFIRSNTKPIEENRAALWKKRLAITYTLLAWNGFGLVLFMAYKGKGDWAAYYGLKSEEERKLSPGQQWAQTLKMKNAEIYRVSGFHVEKLENPYETNKQEVNEESS